MKFPYSCTLNIWCGIWKPLKTQLKTGCMHKKLFSLTRREVQRVRSAVVFVEFISQWKFTAVTKRAFSLIPYFTKRISGKEKRERFLQRYFHTANILNINILIAVEIWSGTERKTFPTYANFTQGWAWIPSDMKSDVNWIKTTYKRWKHKLLFFVELISLKNSVQRWRFRLSTETWIHGLVRLDHDYFPQWRLTICVSELYASLTTFLFLTVWRNSSCEHLPSSRSNIFWNNTFSFRVHFINLL